MARMYPEHYPGPNEPDNPEFVVYQSLRMLPESYSVLYSRKFKGGKKSKEECEIDFLVFDGNQSLLCVEVKGGLIEYSGSDDAWFQNGNRLVPSPDRQASSGKAAVLEFLGEAASDLNVGWALCFPQCNLPATFQPPAGLPRPVLIDQSKLLNIAGSIDATNAYYISEFHRSGVTHRRAEEIVEKLTRSIGFINKIGVRAARDYRQLVEVTDEQMQVLDDLAVNRRIAVKGYAGSGKTLIAQEFAKRLATDGNSVLLLFFNRMVANAVRYGIPREMPIECTTFHSLARKLISEYEPDWWAENKSNGDDFWNVAVPLKLFDVTPGVASRFDAVIVDEGQDFKTEWYEVLETLLNDRDEGRFVVLYDEMQDIFGHWNDLPWGANVARKVLSKNCRNTKSIVQFLSDTQSCHMMPFERSPVGEQVVGRTCESVEQEQRLLVADVKTLLSEGISPGQILFILNQPRQESCLASLEQIGRHRIEAMGRTYREHSKSLRFTNIRLFKGLEADVVFVVGLPATGSDDFQRQLYTQASRARLLLYAYRRTDLNQH